MSTLIAFLIIATYLGSTGLLVKQLGQGENPSRRQTRLQLLPAWVGLCLHAALLYPELMLAQGFDLSFFHALSAAAWLILALLLLLALVLPVASLGIGVLPLATIIVILSHLVGGASSEAPVPQELKLHIISSIFAYSLLSLAAMQALLLAIQSHYLHQHQPGGFIRALPPLQRMEDLLFQFLAAGFVLLSISLLSGFVYLDDMFAQHLVHKTVLSLIAWSVFAILLLGRQLWGWRGRKAVHWTLAGISLLILAYFGSKAVLELILHR